MSEQLLAAVRIHQATLLKSIMTANMVKELVVGIILPTPSLKCHSHWLLSEHHIWSYTFLKNIFLSFKAHLYTFREYKDKEVHFTCPLLSCPFY